MRVIGLAGKRGDSDDPPLVVHSTPSHGLEIRGGGAVSVDTVTLRDAASRFDLAHDDLVQLASRLADAQDRLAHADTAGDVSADARFLHQRLADAAQEAATIAELLRVAAAGYEVVELDAAAQAARLAGDEAATRRIEAARAVLLDAYPGARFAAAGLAIERAVMWPSELVRQGTELGFGVGSQASLLGGAIGGVGVGGAALLFGAVTGISGSGLVARDARLAGGAVPVTLRGLRTEQASGPPASLAAAASRIPTDAARVRVERYAMPDGTRRFAVYVAGTKTIGAAGEAWDMASNVDLYTGRESASYTATVEALTAAGAEPGDVVYAVGHSQGAMVASHLAVEGGYDMRAVVTFGSPVEAEVGADTLSVRVQHTDDPVAALAGGGHLAPVGAPGSVLVERAADAETGLHDLTVGAHALQTYIETSAQADASGDPRIGLLHDTLAELGEARSVETFVYAAIRG